MVSQPKPVERQGFIKAREQRAEINRDIARSLESMNETTSETRELIGDCRAAMKKSDRLLKRE
jgi:hypothetical protein